MNRAIKLLRDKKGMTVTIQMFFAFIIVTILLCCAIGVGAVMHTTNVLDRFADEMAMVVSTQGKCKGNEVSDRFNKLVETTGISPNITYEADYYNNTNKTVQYGEAITVHLTYETKLIGWGDFYLPMTLNRKSTRQSMQYWK